MISQQDFDKEYANLKQEFPREFGSIFKELEIYKLVKDLDLPFFKALVRRIVLSSNPKIDIDAAVRGERLARNQSKRTQELLEASDNFDRQASERGYSETLKKLGANNLLEAIAKNSKTTKGEN